MARELKNLWNMKVTMIPIVISALGRVPKELVEGLDDLKIRGRVEDHPKNKIIEIGQNIKESPRDLKRLAVTQTPVENHQLTLV